MAKILCVDDEPNIVSLKCTILEAAGHEATPSTSAEDAIEKLEHNAYDAVVTDWRLGDANGRAVLQAAKINSTMPVVVVSGYVSEAFQAPEPLADLYLEKPINPEELVTIVNELLKIGDKVHGERPASEQPDAAAEGPSKGALQAKQGNGLGRP
ncbi:MAG: response regulator [Candidatus Korobacteraceae bacterium]